MKTMLLVIAVVAYLVIGYVWTLIARSKLSRINPMFFAAVSPKVILVMTAADCLVWPLSMPMFLLLSRRLAR